MTHTVTLIPGDGIGPEISHAMQTVIEATGVDIQWDVRKAGKETIKSHGTPLPDDTLDSIRLNGAAIKGPITTPIGTGFRSVNVSLRKKLDLYACVRPSFSIPGTKSKYENIDLVVVRENTEDLYAGIERMVDEDTAESIKRITRKASERIVKFAFDYARNEGRNLVTVVTKANIMKFSDGLFLEAAKKVSQNYPDIQFEERLVDNMCMQLVQKPELYDVMVMPNLYGDIISDLCAGLVGGLGIAPGANIGDNIAVFEPVHGSAPKYAGLNKVNPTAIILSGALMLSYLGCKEESQAVVEAVKNVIGEGKYVTYDLGGTSTTTEMAEAVASKV